MSTDIKTLDLENRKVVKEIIKAGDGKTIPKKGDTVSMHYTGTLTDGTKFDSSVDRGTPFETKIGVGMVIKGWDEGILGIRGGSTMTKGEKAKLYIHSSYAYGDRGFPPVIPAKSDLIFEVELLDIIPAGGAKEEL
ncbi:hypothetical protein Dda_3912 [Drechslerella dactyloides]|uniref:peptidylprolyl isomerase n=1 Tax=Drechslerella dactyloides TaxID=74499 RepID=A0AAD6J0A5_DREDA|nr:hypothetical protein Dda_3912 [Drechslerella dactyloides]